MRSIYKCVRSIGCSPPLCMTKKLKLAVVQKGGPPP